MPDPMIILYNQMDELIGENIKPEKLQYSGPLKEVHFHPPASLPVASKKIHNPIKKRPKPISPPFTQSLMRGGR